MLGTQAEIMNKLTFSVPWVIEELRAWADHGKPVDSTFTEAVLLNDLHRAVGIANDKMLSCLREILWYVHWNIPSGCHGSPERVKCWEQYKYRCRVQAASTVPAESLNSPNGD